MIEKVVFYEGKLYKRQDTVRMEVINEKKITYFTGQIHCAGHAGSGDDTSQESVLSGKHTPGLQAFLSEHKARV